MKQNKLIKRPKVTYYEINPQVKNKETPGHREVSLWKGVIMQAFLDCGTLSKRTEDTVEYYCKT